jgi:exopolysaccharide biosynthesis polyprenyl glycosylphosphotransferase
MISEQTRAVRAVFLVSDLIAVATAFVAGYLLRTRLLGAPLGPIYAFDVQAPGLLLALPIWIASFYLTGLYRTPAPRLTLREAALVIRATLFAVLALGVGTFALKFILLSRVVIGLFVVLTVPAVLGGRAVMRWLVLNGRVNRNVVIAGSLAEVRRVAELVAGHREWGLRVGGFVTDGTWAVDAPGLPAPVLGSEDDLPAILKRHVIDEVLIIPSLNRLDSLNVSLERCHEEGVVARVLLNFMFVARSHVALEELGGEPLISFSTAPKDELLLLIRRAFDIAIALVVLIVLSPVFLAIAAAIRLASPGAPAIFRQLRAGLHGRRFWMLKFRSMIPEADALKSSLEPYNEMEGPAFKMSNDPRVTPFGRFLRRTSLDELPQFWNILKGEMSYVGPRPVPVEEAMRYEPWQRRRLSMKPGLTCLWQVSGRNDLRFEDWMRLDLEYIDNWSLWLDLKIAILTIPAVVRGTGAK